MNVAIRNTIVLDEDMNAMIIYDNFDRAMKAQAMLVRAARRMGKTMHWIIKPWRVDLLKLSPAADTALVEGVDAHLIMFSMRSVQPLHPWLLDWLRRWATIRQFKDAALAVWEGENADSFSGRGMPELSQFAMDHGLSIISDNNPLVKGESAVYASHLHEREVSLTPTLQHILDQKVREDYRNWSIND